MFSDLVNQFLLLGSEDSVTENPLSPSTIKERADLFLEEWAVELDRKRAVERRLLETKLKVESTRAQLFESNIVPNLQKYCSLQNEIALVTMASGLASLSSCDNVADMPDLIMSLVENKPKVFPTESKLRGLLMETVNTIRSSLLTSFHSQFEVHITTSQNESDSNDADELWTHFISSSHHTLQAYVLVSLLPMALSESPALLLEKFQDVLDDALTPMWSRYHFHLQAARDASSFEQLIWTFSYTRSFVELLSNLCGQLAAVDGLQRMHPFDYGRAAVDQIISKTIKFMRAHLASSLLKYSPLDGASCASLVEHVLELDHHLYEFGSRNGNLYGDVGTGISSGAMTIVGVIYDAKVIHSQWVLLEHSFFSSALRAATSDVKRVFSFEFGDSDAGSVGVNTGGGGIERSPDSSSASSAYRCYFGIYECLRLVVIASKRYALLPAASQDMLCELVIEPLLCVAVGLCLLKIRLDPVLYAISCRSSAIVRKLFRDELHFGGGSGSGHSSAVADARRVPSALSGFRDSVLYFRAVMSYAANRRLCARSDRFQEKYWSRLHDWAPKKAVVTEEQLSLFNPSALTEAVLLLVEPEEACQRYGGRAGADSSGGSSAIGAVFDLSCLQQSAMLEVLEKHWTSCK